MQPLELRRFPGDSLIDPISGGVRGTASIRLKLGTDIRRADAFQLFLRAAIELERMLIRTEKLSGVAVKHHNRFRCMFKNGAQARFACRQFRRAFRDALFERRVELFDFILGLLALRDVGHRADVIQHLAAVFIAHGNRVVQSPPMRAVAPQILDFLIAIKPIAREQFEQASPIVAPRVKLFPRHIAHFLQRRVTRHPQISAIGEDQFVMRPGPINRLGNVVRNRHEQLLMLAQFVLGAFAFRNVARD